MALIPPFFLDCVVAIGTLNDKFEKVWVGTGFLVGKLNKVNEDGTKNYSPYLVTNKHVLKNLDKIIVRFNPQTDQAAKDFVIDSKDAAGNQVWTGHSNPNYDVAVIRLNGDVLQKEGLKFGLFVDDDSIISLESMKNLEVTEGDFIYVLGFPMGIVAKDRQHVIVRQGVIARIRDLFENRNTDFVVDAVVFPGNSGGPVILKPEVISITGTKSNPKAGLIGIIKSYIPYQDIAISQQTNRPRVIFEENSGLSLVEPVDHILETIIEDEKSKNVA
jgi:S1-C subfamily serine protease